MIRGWTLLAGALAFGGLLAADEGRASYAFFVGKALTEDGSVLVGGTGEEVSSHALRVVPAKRYPPGATLTVGVTGEADLPGALIEIPQARRTSRYLAMTYTDFKGLPPPLVNGGLNEHHVAVRDVWSPSRPELVAMTPSPQRGVNYSDLARIVLQRARTAREAVEIAGRLIDEHGYATYGGNSHLFADPDEGWVMIEYAGGQGLWVAERLEPDEVRVLYPGYVGEVPHDFQEHPGFMGSDNLISFAVEQGWYAPSKGAPFDAHQAYAAPGRDMKRPGIKFVDPATLEADLREKAPVGVADMMAAVRDYRIADDEAGYGQVAHLRQGVPGPLGLLWVAPTGSIAAPFLPWRVGVTDVPPEFRPHRYLTRRAGSTFLHPDYAAQEATVFAGRVFKRLLYYTCEHPAVFLPEVTGALTAYEARLLDEQAAIEQTARTLYDANKPELARRYLTFYSETRALEGLRLGEDLLASVEARTKVRWGIRKPRGDRINMPGHDTVNCRRTGATPAMQRPQAPEPPPPMPDDQVYGPR